MKNIIFGLLSLTLIGCEIFAVVDTNKDITVINKTGNNQYRVEYYYKGSIYFMELITFEDLKIGDKLEFKIK